MSKIDFLREPKNKSWTSYDGEIILFEHAVCGGKTKQISIDANITSEIVGADGFSSSADNELYNVYKLYVNGELVAQTGYESETDQYAPNLSPAHMIWAGDICRKHSTTIKVTAELIVRIDGFTTEVNSNVDKTVGKFRDAKGAFLRVVRF